MSDLFTGDVGVAKDEREYLTVMINGTKHYFALSQSVDPAFAIRMGNPGSYNRRRHLERGASEDTEDDRRSAAMGMGES
jgi:hypothetical protein